MTPTVSLRKASVLSCWCQWHYDANVSTETPETSPLTLIGLDVSDERLYRQLLRGSGSSLRTLSEVTGMAPHTLLAEVARFEALGLVRLEGDVVRAVAPDLAFESVLTAEHERLETAAGRLDALRSMVPSLVAEHLVSRHQPQRPADVQAVEDVDVVALLRSLAEDSTGDMLWLRPDQWRLAMAQDMDDLVRTLLASGRRSRAIYPARVLEEAPNALRRRAEAGEEVRILAVVPARLSILGHSAALMPDRWGDNSGRRLVVREDSLVGALTAFFESLWDRAMSVPGLDGQRVDLDGNRGRQLLLQQLAGGAKDEQIARALGISLRTVRRRVAELLDDLAVDSRFQAGVEAVRRGWI